MKFTLNLFLISILAFPALSKESQMSLMIFDEAGSIGNNLEQLRKLIQETLQSNKEKSVTKITERVVNKVHKCRELILVI